MPRRIDIPGNLRKRIQQEESRMERSRSEIKVLRNMLKQSEQLAVATARATPRRRLAKVS